MGNWTFELELSGEGETEEEAWADAIAHFEQDPGEPTKATLQEEPEDGQDE